MFRVVVVGVACIPVWSQAAHATDLTPAFGGAMAIPDLTIGRDVLGQHDSSGNVFFAASFKGEADVEPGPGTLLLQSNTFLGIPVQDTCIVKFDPVGQRVYGFAIGNKSTNWLHDLIVDSAGNAILLGSYDGTIDLDPSPNTFELDPVIADQQSTFIAKYSPSGAFIWGGAISSGDSFVHGVIDAADNLYLTTEFTGTVDLDPGPGTEFLSSPEKSTYILKLDSNGNFVYAHHIAAVDPQSDSYVIGTKVRRSLDGRLALLGGFEGEIDFDPGVGELVIEDDGNPMVFIAQFTDTGSPLSTTTFPFGASHRMSLQDMAFDSAGNLYVVADFVGTIDVDPGPETVLIEASRISERTAVLKYDAAGDFVWVRTFSDTGAVTLSTSKTFPSHVRIKSDGTILIAGEFAGIVDFDPGPDSFELATTVITPTFTVSDGYLLTLSPDGDFIEVEAVTGNGLVTVSDLSVGPNDGLVIAGGFAVDIDLDPGPGTYPVDEFDPLTFGRSHYLASLGYAASVTSFANAITDPTNVGTVAHTLTFDADVAGVDASDFHVSTTGGITGAGVSGISGAGGSYTVMVDTGSGDGTLQLQLQDDDTIRSTTFVPLGGFGSGNGDATSGAITLDKTPPGIAIGPPSASITATGPVTFTVGYTGASAVALSGGDVSLLTTGSATGSLSVLGTGTDMRTIVIDTISGTGSLGVSIGGATASDLAGNTAGAAGPSASVTVNPSAIAVNIGAPSAFLVNGGPVTYPVLYDNAAVVTLSTSDVSLVTTGSATANVSVSGSGTAARTVSIDDPQGAGTIAFSIASNTASDGGSGFAPAAGPGASFAVDTVPPYVIGADPSSSKGIIQTYTLVFSEPVTGVDTGDVSLRTAPWVTGAFITGVSGPSPGAVYTVSVDTGVGSGPILVAVDDNDTILDLAGNPLGGPGIGNGDHNGGAAILPISAAVFVLISVLLVAGTGILRRRAA